MPLELLHETRELLECRVEGLWGVVFPLSSIQMVCFLTSGRTPIIVDDSQASMLRSLEGGHEICVLTPFTVIYKNARPTWTRYLITLLCFIKFIIKHLK